MKVNTASFLKEFCEFFKIYIALDLYFYIRFTHLAKMQVTAYYAILIFHPTPLKIVTFFFFYYIIELINLD